MRLPAAALLLALLLAPVGAVRSGFTATASAGASRFAAAPVFAPRLLAPPVVNGVAKEGETLTATTGTWARTPRTMLVEWLRCAETCTTVGTGTSRVLTADDVGRRMRVRVTATNDGGSTAATSEPTATVVQLVAPHLLSPPVVSGTPVVGQTLTAGDGTWSGDRLTITRRWLRCTTSCLAIAGERDRTHLVTGDDAGATIAVETTAANTRGSETARSAATAAVSRATYAHLLCTDPATGAGVATDGALPDGLRLIGTMPERYDPAPHTRCAPGGQDLVVPLATGGTYRTKTPDDRLVLEYRPAPGTELRGAALYRHGAMSGPWSWSINTATTDGLSDTPTVELCGWRDGCTTRGTTVDRFAAQNRVDVPPGPGFNIVLACDLLGGGRCETDGSQIVRLFGGRVALRDPTTPTVTAVAGGLTHRTPLNALEDLDLTASDAGSGLYRVRVTIDGAEVAARALHDNGGRCVPASADPYAFAHRQPCVSSLATSLLFDTTGWPRTGRLRVYLEDAGRNTTVLVNRAL
jgi:hypothetical protein